MSATAGKPSAASFASVLKHAGIYGLGNVGIRIAGLLLVPLYTYNLSPAQYGIIEYLDLTALAIGMLFSLGLANAIYRYYYLAPEGERKRVVSTALLPILAVSFAIAAALFLAAPWLAQGVFHDPRFTRWLRILFVGFGFNMVAEFGMTYLAVLLRSALFSTITVIKFIVGALLNVFFLVGLHWGVEGILVSNLITNLALGGVLLAYVIRSVGLSFDGALLQKMVGYGYPLVLVQLSLFGINFADRFFLQASAGFAQVGIYALAYKFGIMLNTLVVASFFQVWNAKSFEVASDPAAPSFYTRVFSYFTLGLLAAGLGMSLVIRDVIGIVAPPAYAAAARLVPLVVVAYVLNGIGTYFELGMKLKSRTPLLSVIFAATCLLCLGLYAVMIPRWGMFGAVLATVIAFAFKAVWVYREGQRAYPIRFEFGRIVPAALLAAGVWALRALLPPMPLIASLGVGIALFLAYVALMWGLGWIRREEREALLAWLRARWRPGTGGPAPEAS
ncbi:MAG TPA: lipopolysaccharide biosynthesis protein [Candidatus Eisenbacteria bacterium]|nr:lipopolysaccharide biosynthesis protein [Candidatus Eisenbacteria bacterium]